MVKDLHVDRLLDVVHGDGEGLVPPGVEVLVDDSTLVNLLSSHFELDVRVTGTWQHMATAALSLTHMPSRRWFNAVHELNSGCSYNIYRHCAMAPDSLSPSRQKTKICYTRGFFKFFCYLGK